MTSRADELGPVVAGAQRVAGLVAARGRGDQEGTRRLLASFHDEGELAGGALLVAELSLGMLSRESGESLEQCAPDLSLQMEHALLPDTGD